MGGVPCASLWHDEVTQHPVGKVQEELEVGKDDVSSGLLVELGWEGEEGALAFLLGVCHHPHVQSESLYLWVRKEQRQDKHS